MKKLIVGLFVLVILSSCTSSKHAHLAQQIERTSCNQQTPYSYTKNDLPIPFDQLVIDTVLSHHYSFQSLNAANAIGLLDELHDFMNKRNSYHAGMTLESRVALLTLVNKINQKINIASLEISAFASELDCEEERADQIASFLKSNEDNREQGLIIGSTIVGAVGAIAAELVANNSANGSLASIIAIGTSVTEAILGVLMLTNHQKIDFYHHRNILKDIWEAPELSSYYSPSIWYYLNYKNPNDKENSLLKKLVHRWMNLGQIVDTQTKNKEAIYALYFGEGGRYTAEQLKNRAAMLDQVEASITLMKQDLKVLSIEFEKYSE